MVRYDGWVSRELHATAPCRGQTGTKLLLSPGERAKTLIRPVVVLAGPLPSSVATGLVSSVPLSGALGGTSAAEIVRFLTSRNVVFVRLYREFTKLIVVAGHESPVHPEPVETPPGGARKECAGASPFRLTTEGRATHPSTSSGRTAEGELDRLRTNGVRSTRPGRRCLFKALQNLGLLFVYLVDGHRQRVDGDQRLVV